MPELPDVEAFRRQFASAAIGRRIADVELLAPAMLERVSPSTFRSHLKTRRFVRTNRHGKYLFAQLDRGGWLVLHFGMTGFLERDAGRDEAPLHTRLRLDFADGSHLAYADQRKFGSIGLTEDVRRFVHERRLGPDPLGSRFDFRAFKAAIERRRGALKAALLNQRVIAGIGNIYADEILFQARLHPTTRLDRLRKPELHVLYGAIRRVLSKAVQAGANADRLPRGYLLRHRRRGGHCPRCRRALAQLRIGGRTTYYCARDQPKRA